MKQLSMCHKSIKNKFQISLSENFWQRIIVIRNIPTESPWFDLDLPRPLVDSIM